MDPQHCLLVNILKLLAHEKLWTEIALVKKDREILQPGTTKAGFLLTEQEAFFYVVLQY
jgi:hypothetical protein